MLPYLNFPPDKIDLCPCGEEFNKYKWDCIPIKRENYDSNGYKKYGVPDYSYLYICPKCGTIKARRG